MSAEFQVKQFELAEQEALLRFLQSAYPDEPRKSDRAFWKWHYLENPNTDLRDIPLWIVKSGNDVVGQMGTIPVELKAGDSTRRALWILDFIVDARFRGQGLGRRLVLAAREKYSTLITLGINAQSTAVFNKLNWSALGRIHRYQKLLFPGHDLPGKSSWKLAEKAVNLLFTPFRPGTLRLEPRPGTDIHVLDHFDESFEGLWHDARRQWPVAVKRRPKFLEWQFFRQPGKKFEALGLKQAGRWEGYAVLYFRTPRRG